ncbi:MAG: integrin alpha [Legionellaceae bacterium]|nr:integrin alpha [Legionellaceae bacterium]
MPKARAQFPATVDLGSLSPDIGITIGGFAANSLAGYAATNVGDINGDGRDDTAIGAIGVDNNAGAVYIVFSGSEVSSLDDLNGTNGFKIAGFPPNAWGGCSISSARNLTGSGVISIIIGARYANNFTGAVYVVHYTPDIGGSGIFSINDLNGSNGFKFTGVTVGDSTGFSVSSARNLTGNGFDSIIIGAPKANNLAGITFVIFGRSDIGSDGIFPLTSLNGTNGLKLMGDTPGDLTGYSVSSTRNDNGVTLLIIGAPEANNSTGAVLVVFFSPGIGGSSGVLSLADLNGIYGYKIRGNAPGDLAGCSVSSAKNINGNGFNSIIIGAYGANNYTGAVYIVFSIPGIGGSGIFPLTNLNETNGLSILGVTPGDWTGFSVSSAGNINGNGFNSIIISAPRAGAVFVVFGEADIGNPVIISLANLNNRNGIKFIGNAPSDWPGFSVSSTGNGIIIGGPYHNNSAGAIYIIFGKQRSTLTFSLSEKASPTDSLRPTPSTSEPRSRTVFVSTSQTPSARQTPSNSRPQSRGFSEENSLSSSRHRSVSASTPLSLSQPASATNPFSESKTIPLVAPFTDLTFMPQTDQFALITNEAKFRVISQANSLTLKLRLPRGIGQFMTQRPEFNKVFSQWDADSSTLTIICTPSAANTLLQVMADSIYAPINYNSPILLAASEGGDWILGQGNTEQFELNHAPEGTGIQYPNITVTPNQEATQNLDAIPKRFNDTDGDSYTYYMTDTAGNPLSANAWSALRNNQWSGKYGAYGSFCWFVYVVDSGSLRSPSLRFCSNFEYIKPYLKNQLTNKNFATGVTFSDPISLDTFGGDIASWSAFVNGQELPAQFASLMFTKNPPAVNGKINQDSIVNVTLVVHSQYGDSAATWYLLTLTTTSPWWTPYWTVGSYLLSYGLPALTIYALRYEIPNILFYKNTNTPVEEFFNAYGEHTNLGCFHSLFPGLVAKSELALDSDQGLESPGCVSSLLAKLDARYPNTVVYPQILHIPHSKDLGLLDAFIAKLLSWMPWLPMRIHEYWTSQKLPELIQRGGFVYNANTNTINCIPEKIILLGDIKEILLLITTLNGLILARTKINLSDMKERKFSVRENKQTLALPNFEDTTGTNTASKSAVVCMLQEETHDINDYQGLSGNTSRESSAEKDGQEDLNDPLNIQVSQARSPISATHGTFFLTVRPKTGSLDSNSNSGSDLDLDSDSNLRDRYNELSL